MGFYDDAREGIKRVIRRLPSWFLDDVVGVLPGDAVERGRVYRNEGKRAWKYGSEMRKRNDELRVGLDEARTDLVRAEKGLVEERLGREKLVAEQLSDREDARREEYRDELKGLADSC